MQDSDGFAKETYQWGSRFKAKSFTYRQILSGILRYIREPHKKLLCFTTSNVLVQKLHIHTIVSGILYMCTPQTVFYYYKFSVMIKYVFNFQVNSIITIGWQPKSGLAYLFQAKDEIYCTILILLSPLNGLVSF